MSKRAEAIENARRLYLRARGTPYEDMALKLLEAEVRGAREEFEARRKPRPL